MVQEGLLKPDFSIHRKVSNDLVFASFDLTEKERKIFIGSIKGSDFLIQNFGNWDLFNVMCIIF